MSARLERFIEKAVEVVNKNVDIEEFKEKYSPGENRSMLFVVRGRSSDYGFVIDVDKIRVKGEVENPTVTVSCDENTFWRITLKKITLDYAVATRKLSIVGEYFLRDYLILRRLFNDLTSRLNL